MLVILYDDTGQAAWSPYGGRIEMPTLDRLAKNGLTYSQWHTTAVWSHHRLRSRSRRPRRVPRYPRRVPSARHLQLTWVGWARMRDRGLFKMALTDYAEFRGGPVSIQVRAEQGRTGRARWRTSTSVVST